MCSFECSFDLSNKMLALVIPMNSFTDIPLDIDTHKIVHTLFGAFTSSELLDKI